MLALLFFLFLMFNFDVFIKLLAVIFLIPFILLAFWVIRRCWWLGLILIILLI